MKYSRDDIITRPANPLKVEVNDGIVDESPRL